MSKPKTYILALFLIVVIGASFRFYKINSNPPGLYWDETVFGYDAYSILKTGRDHHGKFLPLFFESFGDWKLPIYHYLLVPSVAIFGLTEFAVRFPSAFFSTLSIPVLFLLVKSLTKKWEIALCCAFILAISPWNIQFARGGFETSVGLFFTLLGLLMLIRAFEVGKASFFALSFFSFVISMYTYHAYRIFVPLLLVCSLFIFREKLRSVAKKILIPAFLSVLLFLPLVSFSLTKEGKTRGISQAAFREEEYEYQRINFDQNSKKPLRFLSKYWSLPLFYSYQALESYAHHFSPVFLFFRGDQIARHSQVDMGQLFGFQLILVIVSLTFIKKVDSQARLLILFWLILSPLPAVIVTPSPHANRTLQMSVVLSILSGFGLYQIIRYKSKVVLGILSLVVIYSILSFGHLLFVHYPKKFALDWQDGNKEMVEQLLKYESDYDKIYITDINQVPYIYLLFYGKYSPAKFIAEGGTRKHFGKYYFIERDFDVYSGGRALYVAPSWEKVNGKWLAAANDRNKIIHIYSLWEVNGEN